MLCLIGSEIADKGFRNWHIYGIHTHMVTVVGCPTESKLRKVACADNKTVIFVWKVHKNLRSFSRLWVFVGYICNAFIVVDICKMLTNSFCNVDIFKRHSVSLSQKLCVWFCTLCRAETRHCYSMNILSVNTEHIKSMNADDESKRTVKTSWKS